MGSEPLPSIRPNGCADPRIIALTGSVRADRLPEIERSMSMLADGHTRLAFDLSEVTVIDRVAARFFAQQLEQGIELVDCPSYLRSWIVRELKHE